MLYGTVVSFIQFMQAKIVALVHECVLSKKYFYNLFLQSPHVLLPINIENDRITK